MLHIVNKSPFGAGALQSCLEVAKPGSTILLIEDGVYAGVGGTAVSAALQAAMDGRTVCALQSDVDARGVGAKLLDGITLVDYAGFVDLAAASDGVQSWL